MSSELPRPSSCVDGATPAAEGTASPLEQEGAPSEPGGALRRRLTAMLAVELRSPLARIALAASRLPREALTPAGTRLAESVLEAVSDLDRLVDQIQGLAGGPEPGGEAAPLLAVIDSLRVRMQAVLAARDVEWRDGPALPDLGCGDPDVLRALLTASLRCAVALAGTGGHFQLEPVSDLGGARGVAWCCRGRDSAGGSGEGADGAAEEALSALRALALVHGVPFEVRQQEDLHQVLLWWSGGRST